MSLTKTLVRPRRYVPAFLMKPSLYAGAVTCAAFFACSGVTAVPGASAPASESVESGGDGNNTESLGAVSPVPSDDESKVVLTERFVGRVQAEMPVFSWPGSGIELAFRGTNGRCSFAVQGNVRMGLSVDGGPMNSQILQPGVPVTFGPLPAGEHIAQILMLNEGRLGTAAFQGCRTDGAAVPLKSPARRLIFIGDSITAAYGVDGNAPCVNSAAREDATASFASIAAKSLQSDFTLLAVAGRGVWRNDTSDKATAPVTMQQISKRFNSVDANSTYSPVAEDVPRAVVLTLGTNDYEYTATDAKGSIYSVRPAIDHEAFRASYSQLLSDLRGLWPEATLILCSSPLLDDTYPSTDDAQHKSLLTDLEAIAATLPNTSILDLASLPTSQRTGCNGHPSRAAHVALAATLSKHLKSLLNW